MAIAIHSPERSNQLNTRPVDETSTEMGVIATGLGAIETPQSAEQQETERQQTLETAVTAPYRRSASSLLLATERLATFPIDANGVPQIPAALLTNGRYDPRKDKKTINMQDGTPVTKSIYDTPQVVSDVFDGIAAGANADDITQTLLLATDAAISDGQAARNSFRERIGAVRDLTAELRQRLASL